MDDELARVLAQHRVVAVAAWPQLRGAIHRAHRKGQLDRMLPGVYARNGAAEDWRHRVLAVSVRHADAVVVGRAAAALGFWPDCRVGRAEVARRSATAPATGFLWLRSVVPEDWVVRGGTVAFAHPAWAAVDLAATMGGEPLDEALRAGVGLEELWRARRQMAGYRGSAMRELLLEDSRDAPWSEGERVFHRLLRSGHIEGWSTNVPVAGYRLDVGWPRLKVGVEVDGYAIHGQRQAFEADRLREQRLLARGWVVMHVTWRQCQDTPEEVLGNLRRLLRLRERSLGIGGGQ